MSSLRAQREISYNVTDDVSFSLAYHKSMKLIQTFLCSFVFIGAAYAQPVVAGLEDRGPILGCISELRFPLDHGVNGELELVHARAICRGSIASQPFARGGRALPRIEVHQYHRFGYDRCWDFPVVAKYKFLKGPIRPYVEGGLDFSHLSDLKNFVTANHTSNFGVALGAGVEIRALVMRISPEIRWEGDALQNFTGTVNSNRNQLAFLVGIGF